MDKSILAQYISLKAEIVDLEELICKTEKIIKRLEKCNQLVADSVKGTRKDGTYGNIRIVGYPYQDCEKAKNLLEKRKQKLGLFQNKLLESTNDMDDFINSLEDSRIRRILRHKYMDDLGWVQVASKMNEAYPKKKKKYTADNCRVTVSNFLNEEK